MTKLIDSKELIEVGDMRVLLTKDDMTKYTKVLAQGQDAEVTYIIDKKLTNLEQVKKGNTLVILSEVNN